MSSWAPTALLRWNGGILQQRWARPTMTEVKGGMRPMWREDTEYEWRDVPSVVDDRMPVRASSEGAGSVEQHTHAAGLRPEEFPCTSPANSQIPTRAPHE